MIKKRLSAAIFVASLFFGFGADGFLSEARYFLSAYFRSPSGVGSLLPSFGFLADAMTRYVDASTSPKKILEIGAGTGVFTEKIIEKMSDGDFLDVIEIDPELCKILEEKFSNYDNVRILCLSVLDWEPDYEYDFVVSALPHNVFEPELVDEVLKKYKKLIKNNGLMSYFELMFFARVKKVVLMGESRKKFLRIHNAVENFRKQFQFDEYMVLVNPPPARAYHLRITK